MKAALAVLFIILGIAGLVAGVGYGLYFWGWVCIVGSIVDVINQIKAPEVEAMVIAIAFLKFFWAGLWGLIVGAVSCIPGGISLAIGMSLAD